MLPREKSRENCEKLLFDFVSLVCAFSNPTSNSTKWNSLICQLHLLTNTQLVQEVEIVSLSGYTSDSDSHFLQPLFPLHVSLTLSNLSSAPFWHSALGNFLPRPPVEVMYLYLLMGDKRHKLSTSQNCGWMNGTNRAKLCPVETVVCVPLNQQTPAN